MALIRGHRLGVLVCACLVMGGSSAHAQGWFDEPRAFSVYLENDLFSPGMTDERYTQGLRLTWSFAQWPEWAGATERWLSGLGLARGRRVDGPCSVGGHRDVPCGNVIFGLAQTIYSPRNIITSELQPRDQPFAGWLFATAGFNVRDGRWQSTTEVIAGVTGPASFAEDTQRLAHWTWAQQTPKPGGWRHQLRGGGHLGLVQTYAWHWIEKCAGEDGCTGSRSEKRRVDVTPRFEGVAGTTMVRASAGLSLRAGRNFSSDMVRRIEPTLVAMAPPADSPEAHALADAERSAWWALSASADGRFVPYNGFLTGTYADRGTNGWRELHEIVPRRGVLELSLGIAGGKGPVAMSYQLVRRSSEWSPSGAGGAQKPHYYGALMVSLAHDGR